MAELFYSLFCGRIRLRTFVQYLIAFCSRSEEASYVTSSSLVGMTVANKCVKFRDPSLNRSPKIPPEAVGGVIFGRFSNAVNFRLEVAS